MPSTLGERVRHHRQRVAHDAAHGAGEVRVLRIAAQVDVAEKRHARARRRRRRRWPAVARAARLKRASGLSRRIGSDILPRPFGIEEHGLGDRGRRAHGRPASDTRTFSPIRLRPFCTSASAIERLQVRAEIARRDVAQHRHRARVRARRRRPARLPAARPSDRRSAGRRDACGRSAPCPRARASAGRGSPCSWRRSSPCRDRSGVTEPSVSWPTMMKPFSARSTCIVSVPYGVMPNCSPASISASHTCRASLAQTLTS